MRVVKTWPLDRRSFVRRAGKKNRFAVYLVRRCGTFFNLSSEAEAKAP
jgi:hypothetical protein